MKIEKERQSEGLHPVVLSDFTHFFKKMRTQISWNITQKFLLWSDLEKLSISIKSADKCSEKRFAKDV